MRDLPRIIDDDIRANELSSLEKLKKVRKCIDNIKIVVGGLNHFAFVLDMEDIRTGENLMKKFNANLMDFYKKDKWDRFHFADLTFEIYKRTGWFPYVGDNHLAEYVQIAKDHTKYEDFDDWIEKMEQGNKGVLGMLRRYHNRLQKGRYPKRGVFKYYMVSRNN